MNEITLAELVRANTEGILTFSEYLQMLKFYRLLADPKPMIDYLGEQQ